MGVRLDEEQLLYEDVRSYSAVVIALLENALRQPEAYREWVRRAIAWVRLWQEASAVRARYPYQRKESARR